MRKIVAGAIITLLLGSAGGSRPELEVRGATPVQHELLGWALNRFERAGLALPEVVVEFHAGDEACDGHPGLYRNQPSPMMDLCAVEGEFSTANKKTVLHELAHAWADASLTEADRGAFLELRGLEEWTSPDTTWEHEGIEHAAEILAWALFDRELRMVTIPDAEPSALAQVYLMLTGSPPPDR